MCITFDAVNSLCSLSIQGLIRYPNLCAAILPTVWAPWQNYIINYVITVSYKLIPTSSFSGICFALDVIHRRIHKPIHISNQQTAKGGRNEEVGSTAVHHWCDGSDLCAAGIGKRRFRPLIDSAVYQPWKKHRRKRLCFLLRSYRAAQRPVCSESS